MIMGVAVSGMHYTGMAALRVHAAPGLAGTGAASASAGAFLLPLILGIGSVGFIFSAVIALSPTAAEMIEEADLMTRIGRHSRDGHDTRPPAPGPADRERPGSLFHPRPPSSGPDEQ
jgi:hypothetical protein